MSVSISPLKHSAKGGFQHTWHVCSLIHVLTRPVHGGCFVQVSSGSPHSLSVSPLSPCRGKVPLSLGMINSGNGHALQGRSLCHSQLNNGWTSVHSLKSG